MSIKLLLRSFCLTGILFVPVTCVFSQQPDANSKPAISAEKRALVLELLEVTEARKTSLAVFNSILDQDQKDMPEFVWQGLLSTKYVQELSADAKEALRKKTYAESARMNTRLRELFSERIDFPRLVEELSVDLYDKYFTEAELRDLIVFYGSPTGKKAIAVMPKMLAESMSKAAEGIRPKLLDIISVLTNEEAERIKNESQAEKNKPAKKAPAPGRRRKP